MLNVRQEFRRQHFGNKWVFLWLPTFRDSKGNKGRRDGTPEQSILHQVGNFQALHECLRELNAVCVIKPHPLDDISAVSTSLPEAVQFWTDQDLDDRSLSLYELIGLSHALITDVSSVYFEYQQLDRPIFCFFPDFEAYESGRGFVRPFRTLIDDPILHTEQELIEQIQASFQVRARGDARPAEDKGQRSALARQVLQKCGMEIQ
jgi:CDP-glycerol glycerophosphotransferase (TagB/SpsB family)